MAHATANCLFDSLHAAARWPSFARGLIIAVALSLPVWAGVIYCAVRLL